MLSKNRPTEAETKGRSVCVCIWSRQLYTAFTMQRSLSCTSYLRLLPQVAHQVAQREIKRLTEGQQQMQAQEVKLESQVRQGCIVWGNPY